MSFFAYGKATPTLAEQIDAVRLYSESGNSQQDRMVFLTPALHAAVLATLNSHATLLSQRDAAVAALRDARMRFANIADECYAHAGHDAKENCLAILQNQAAQDRDAIDSALKACER